jgi:phage terminase large subunit
MMLELATPEVFEPLLEPARYKGAWGGRGSGKSHFFAEAIIEQALMFPGMRAVCIREVQNTLKESSKRLIEDKLIEHSLGAVHGFKVFKDVIETPGDGVIIFNGMQDANAESIKSLEGFKIAWVEEAQTLSSRSLSLLRPTIRGEDSELWFSWNARRKTDPVDMLLRGAELPTGAVVVQANWRDNPFFPRVLEQERLDCLRLQPDQYNHIWEGGYATVLVGAYYAKHIADARSDGRIGHVSPDPLLPIKLFIDIGGTGAKSDAFVIWAAQFVGREVRVLDYYETVGQPMSSHLGWLRERSYTPRDAEVYLPHDGRQMDKVFAVSYESSFRDAGYGVTVVPNQGAGAASARIESGRRMFPSCRFHELRTAPGLEAIGWYHEKQDEARNIGLGPEHDWASHGADAFGLMCIVAEQQFAIDPRWSVIDYRMMDRGIAA